MKVDKFSNDRGRESSGNEIERDDKSIENCIQKINFHQTSLVTVLDRLAKLYEERQDWEQALTCYQKIIDINPKNSKAYISIGKIFLDREKSDEAKKSEIKTIEVDPSQSFLSYFKLGEEKEKEHQLDEAINCYQKASQLDASNYLVYLRLGSALIRSGDLNRGIISFVQCIKLNPECAQAHDYIYDKLHLPGMKFSQESLDRIINIYRELIKTKSEQKKWWIIYYLNLANALSCKHNYSEAIAWYQTASAQQLKAVKPKFVSQYWEHREEQEPSFMIIGSMKCGTTSAYNYIVQHPKVLPAVVKEIKFFNWNFQRGIEWYMSHFPLFPKGKGFLTGEASPNYLNSPESPQRVFQYFPNVKLIIFLRNPIDRAISQYHHWVDLGAEKRSLEAAISSELDALENMTDFNPGSCQQFGHNHVGIGLYTYFIENWMKFFPKEQFLILHSENLNKFPDAVMKNIFEFLNLSDYACEQYKRHNSRSYVQINSKLRSRLYDFFKPHNERLENLLNRKFDWK